MLLYICCSKCTHSLESAPCLSCKCRSGGFSFLVVDTLTTNFHAQLLPQVNRATWLVTAELVACLLLVGLEAHLGGTDVVDHAG
jgi:hypothetical protein